MNDPKRLWEIINSKVSSKTKKKETEIKYIIDKKKQKIFDKQQIANNMIDYYCSVGSELSKKIRKLENKSIKLPKINTQTLFIKPTNTFEIYEFISKLKLKKGGVDMISSKVLKITANFIVKPLTYIFNKCIENAIWPNALKIADIVPVHKGSSKSEMSNYRPISLISNVAKIFEKIIHLRIYKFVNKCKILSSKQFGFIKGVGTKNVLNYITNIIYNRLDKSKPALITFLDLAKAFDTVDHKILLDKLHNIGIRGITYDLMRSYLDKRMQRVKINDCISDEKIINIGVPQGTILGPLLFILYVNDLLTDIQDGCIMSYADDTAIISVENTWDETVTKMNLLLDVVSDWLSLNKLSLNIEKTVFITFGNHADSIPKHVDVKIKDKPIKRVKYCRYLGVFFDCNVKWDKHIEYLVNKTKYLIFVFYKLRKIMNIDMLKSIYYAIFQSIVGYGIIAWGGAYNNCISILQALQNRILKIIYGNVFDIDNRPLHIDQLFNLEVLMYHYDNLKSAYLNSSSVTRNKSILLPKNSKRISEKNSYIRAIKLYNLLPKDIKTLSINRKIIRKKIKKWIVNNL